MAHDRDQYRKWINYPMLKHNRGVKNNKKVFHVTCPN